MTTRETVQTYFDRLGGRADWDSLLAQDMEFTSLTSPVRRIAGKDAFLAATKRFYSTVARLEVRDLLVDGDKACAFTHYHVQPPGGTVFESDVAELFSVRDGLIVAFTICFDTAPYPK